MAEISLPTLSSSGYQREQSLSLFVSGQVRTHSFVFGEPPTDNFTAKTLQIPLTSVVHDLLHAVRNPRTDQQFISDLCNTKSAADYGYLNRNDGLKRDAFDVVLDGYAGFIAFQDSGGKWLYIKTCVADGEGATLTDGKVQITPEHEQMLAYLAEQLSR